MSETQVLTALAEAQGTLPLEGAGGFGWMLLKTALVLVGVCVLAYLVLRYGLTRLGGGASRKARRLTVLDRLELEPRRSLQVVRVGQKVLLVGVGEGGIGLLCELDPDEWADLEARAPRPRQLEQAGEAT